MQGAIQVLGFYLYNAILQYYLRHGLRSTLCISYTWGFMVCI